MNWQVWLGITLFVVPVLIFVGGISWAMYGWRTAATASGVTLVTIGAFLGGALLITAGLS